MERNKLTLKPSGNGGCMPEPEMWNPHRNGNVRIHNKSGHPQKLWSITPCCLFDDGEEVTEIEIQNNKMFFGKASDIDGTYLFNDGESEEEMGTRTGHINPS